MKHNPGIGATAELSLRVSIATLVRVVFQHPNNDKRMLALERKATLHENKIEVSSQPFGGAIRILDLGAIHNLIGDFHFDSERSRTEQDFRIFIRPSSWSVLREFCIQHLSVVDDPVLETDPNRELTEEFFDAIKINLQPGQYVSKPVTTVIENEAVPTDNIRARGIETVRVYRVYEAFILDTVFIDNMISNSASLSNQDLSEIALKDFKNGGKGRANAMLTLPLKQLSDHSLAMPPKERNSPIVFEEHKLSETVFAVLENIPVPKYQRT